MGFAVVFVLLAWRYVEGRNGHGRLSEVPFWRLALLTLAVLLMSATSLIDANWLRFSLFAAALIIAAIAFHRDARSVRNMFPRKITAIASQLGAGYWILFLVSIVITFFNTYTPFYLQVLHDVGPLTAGYLLAVQSMMWTVAALSMSGAKRTTEPYLLAAGLFCVLIATVGIALTLESGPVLAIGIAMGISGIGMGLLNSPLKKALLTGFHSTAKHNATKAVSPSSETMRTI